MFHPGVHTESETLIGYIDAQLIALRNSAYGLTEEQARQTPCRSSLSIAGLLKHATFVMRGHVPGDASGDPAQPAGSDASTPRVPREEEFADSFALRPDESLEGTMEAFDTVRRALVHHLESIHPDDDTVVPPAPWYGRAEPVSVKRRYELGHLIEELARHAGHADIIREQIDGAQAGPLYLAVAGLPGNQFIQPWQPPAEG